MQPLGKDNIVTLNIEAESYLSFKDILARTIKQFNAQNEHNNHITEDINLYRLRVAKKSGMPDTDLPCII